jgi:hypothetical protein
VLGVKVAASTLWEILRDAGIDAAPQRTSDTRATFLHSRAHAIIAADFFPVRGTLVRQRDPALDGLCR